MDTTLVENADGGIEEFRTDVKTLGGSDLVIKVTPSGMYYITSKGGGAPPKITEERFTNLSHAKEALKRFQAEIGPTLRKREIQDAAIARRKAQLDEQG